MLKISPRKIFAVFFFIIISALTLIIFDRQNIDVNDRNNILFFGGIILSALLLLLTALTKSVSIIKQVYKEQTVEHEAKNSPMKTFDSEVQAESFIVEILQGLQNEKSITTYSDRFLRNMASAFHIVQGIFYVKEKSNGKFRSVSTYAFYSENSNTEFESGEGLNGQAAEDKDMKLISDIEEGYIQAVSGLGAASPKNLLIMPFIYKGETIALAELAAFENFPSDIREIYQGIHNVISENIIKLL